MKQVILILCLSFLPYSGMAQQKEFTHMCCYCPCFIADYHKGCHRLCVLPTTKSLHYLLREKDGTILRLNEETWKWEAFEDKIRALNPIESKMCVELCMLKKEGRAHLKHRHED